MVNENCGESDRIMPNRAFLESKVSRYLECSQSARMAVRKNLLILLNTDSAVPRFCDADIVAQFCKVVALRRCEALEEEDEVTDRLSFEKLILVVCSG